MALSFILKSMNRLDAYDRRPAAMDVYLSNYKWHFSKRMCDWAVSMMSTVPEGAIKPEEKLGKIKPMSKEELDGILEKHNIHLDNNVGYDAVYVANMARADHARTIRTEQALAQFVKEYIDDPDGYEGLPFTRFYADCIGSGRPIFWEEML